MTVLFRALFIFLTFTTTTFAEEKPSGITVISLDPKLDAHDFGGNHQFQNQSPKNQTTQKSQMPAREKREMAFTEAGLTEEILKMDALDRDLLYLFAEQRSLGEISKKFPKISEAKLKSLKTWVQKHAKE